MARRSTRRKRKVRRHFGAHGGATYAVVVKGDRAGGYTSRRSVQGDVVAAACTNGAPAVLVRESAAGAERAIYACVPKARRGFPAAWLGRCGCTANRRLATAVLKRIAR
jgi:hypothetical protein